MKKIDNKKISIKFNFIKNLLINIFNVYLITIILNNMFKNVLIH